MAKIAIDEVEGLLLKKKFDAKKVQEVVKELTEIVEELKAEKPERKKWEYVILLDDKDGVLKEKEIAGWVVQQEEGEDAGLVVSKLEDAAKTQNETAKRRKTMLTSLRDIFEGLKPKFLKGKKVRVKTKELTRVIVVNR